MQVYSATMQDYVKYFFTGYKTPVMSPTIMAFLKALQVGILMIVSVLIQGLVNQFSKGDYSLNFTTLQGYVMPGVTLVLIFLLEAIRKITNPGLSLKAMPEPVLQQVVPAHTAHRITAKVPPVIDQPPPK